MDPYDLRLQKNGNFLFFALKGDLAQLLWEISTV